MREPERDNGRLLDIIQAANHILSFTDGYSNSKKHTKTFHGMILSECDMF